MNKKAPIPGQFRNGPPAPTMSKREFMQQYVLNRANTVDSLSGDGAAKESAKAWACIETACAE